MHYDSKSLGQSCPGIQKLILTGPILPRPLSLHKPMSIESLLHLPKCFILAASNEPPASLSSNDAYKATLEAGIAQALKANCLACDDIEYTNFQITDLQAHLNKLSSTANSPTPPESPWNNPPPYLCPHCKGAHWVKHCPHPDEQHTNNTSPQHRPQPICHHCKKEGHVQ